MEKSKKKAVIYAICMAVCATMILVFMFNAKFSFVISYDNKLGSGEKIEELSNLTLFDVSDAIKDKADDFNQIAKITEENYKQNPNEEKLESTRLLISEANSAKALCIASIVVTYITFASAVLFLIVGAFIVLYEAISKKDITVRGLQAMDSLLWIPPFLASLVLLLPIIPMSSLYSLVEKKSCLVSFDFVWGINFIFLFIGAIVIPKICRFICNRIN